MKNECNVVRDLLPLYIEGMLSAETVEFVEEHVAECESCRAVLEELRSPAPEVDASVETVESADGLRSLKRKLTVRKVVVGVVSALSVMALAFAGYMLLFFGVRSESENVRLTAEFQYDESSYLNQQFVLHFEQLEGKPIFVRSEYIWEGDVCVGEVLHVRESPFAINYNPPLYTIGYSFGDVDEPPAEGFDFTITVRFKNETIVYSMREEGLFEPQEDVKYKPEPIKHQSEKTHID